MINFQRKKLKMSFKKSKASKVCGADRTSLKC